MSLQTGVELPEGPASQHLGDRMRYRLTVWKNSPNPLWVREMRQSARLTRTPVILMILSVLFTLMMASVGGIITGTQSPSEAGQALFHTYFSFAYFVVLWIGPAIAANSIASEREGKTWEAVLLTGMHPSEVTRGKFASAYTSMAMYLVMLAPVGALPFIFGGVTPLEVLVAFVFLFLLAVLAVAFGLAISAQMASLRGALLVTLIASVPLSFFSYLLLGLGLKNLPHEIWTTVPRGGPVWLPTAYSLAPFGAEYVIYLMVIPAAAIVLPGWLFYEVTRSKLISVTDDRSYGLKKWFLVTSLVVTLVAMVPLFAVPSRDRSAGIIAGTTFFCVYILFCVFLFAGEAIGPSRRVKLALVRMSALRRFLAPGVMKVAQLQLMVAVLAVLTLTVIGVVMLQTTPGTPRVDVQTEQVVVFAIYALGFSSFLIGLTAYLRARSNGGGLPRVLLLVILFGLSFGPWILAAITGVLGSSSSMRSSAFAIAAPSPGYAFFAVEALTRPDPGVTVVASIGASILYAAVGLGFLLVAGAKCRKIILEHESILARADQRLAAEDAGEVGVTEGDAAPAETPGAAPLLPHAAESAAEAPPPALRPDALGAAAAEPARAEPAPADAASASASEELDEPVPPSQAVEVAPVVEIGATGDEEEA